MAFPILGSETHSPSSSFQGTIAHSNVPCGVNTAGWNGKLVSPPAGGLFALAGWPGLGAKVPLILLSDFIYKQVSYSPLPTAWGGMGEERGPSPCCLGRGAHVVPNKPTPGSPLLSKWGFHFAPLASISGDSTQATKSSA